LGADSSDQKRDSGRQVRVFLGFSRGILQNGGEFLKKRGMVVLDLIFINPIEFFLAQYRQKKGRAMLPATKWQTLP
jgi:hypothetical protein